MLRQLWSRRQASVDPGAKTFRYNHDYYLLKHLTHFVDVVARHVEAIGTCHDALSFANPDGSVVMPLRNELDHGQQVQVKVKDRSVAIELLRDSVSTLAMKSV